jgi:segregation and condensation protein B
MEMGWVRMRGRRRAPGRPVTYGTTDTFLEHFGLDSVKDLPGLSELKGAGLLDSNLPPGFSVPEPHDSPILTPDEDPLEESEEPLDESDDTALDAAGAEGSEVAEGKLPDADAGEAPQERLRRHGQG